MLRWDDVNDSGNDHALAVDEFAVTAKGGGPVVDVAPTVASTSPTNNATDVAVNSNITITFSEPVTVTDGWATLTTGNPPTPVAVTPSGGPTTFTLDPAADLLNSTTYTVTVNAANVTDQDGTPTQMAANYTFKFTTAAPAGVCAPAPNKIYDIQGSGSLSPLPDGTDVTFRGIVTGDFRGATRLDGFFVQDAAGDGNAATSDGIFVYTPAANAFSTAVFTVGDELRITGKVKEFNTLTEIDNVAALTVCSSGAPLAPVVADLPAATPVAGVADQERYEGMYVTFPEELTVNQNAFLGTYGVMTLAAEGRMYNPTNDQGATFAENARRTIVLDDGRSNTSANDDPNPIPFYPQGSTLRAGDVTVNLTGFISYDRTNPSGSNPQRLYVLHPSVQPTFIKRNPRTTAPDPVGGNVKVSAFNVLNYFTTFTSQNAQSRGADNQAEFDRQRTKIITAMLAIDADVFGLMEIQNTNTVPGADATANLVQGLNDIAGAGTYATITTPAPGTDAIKVSLIYKPGKVTPVGAAMNYQTSTASYSPLYDRPPLAQTFSLNSNGAKFSVIVNHFKSKGSCPTGTGPDADKGDGQGCWNAKRTAQAQNMLTFISQVQAAAGDNDVLVMGDLNAYGQEDPIDALVAGGLVNEIARFVPLAKRYSYVFDGTAGYLDHALATASLDTQVSGVTEWHINADEPTIIDYNVDTGANNDSTPKPDDRYTPTPYRSSDHDPVVIGLQLGAPLTPASFAGSSKTVNDTTVQSGDLLTYTLTISNSGQTGATFMLTDTLNANLTFVSANPTMTRNGQQLTATGSVGPNSQTQYVITVRVNAGFSGTINNSATLSGDGQSRTLTAPAVVVTAAPTAANFAGSSKTVNTVTVQTGGLLTYTLSISNSGQLPATFMLTDTLNANLTFVSASPAMVRDGQQLTASALLGGGGSTTYVITVRVNNGYIGVINNSATLSGDGQSRTLTAPSVMVSAVPLKKVYMPFIIR